MILPIHILAGGLALIAGAVALCVRKGSPLHRRIGRFFVYAMVVMGLTAAALGNAGGGLIAIYFVITALLTVRKPARWSRWVSGAACLLIGLLSVATIAKGFQVYARPGHTLNGVPFAMFFFLGTIMAIAAIGDARVLRSGPLRGSARLSRHIWRMCFALFIAAGSFFSIQARVARILPAPFTTPLMRALPVAAIFVAMFYWLWRVRRRPAGLRAE